MERRQFSSMEQDHPVLAASGRVADPHHFNTDPDPSFHFHTDPDPALNQSDANLQQLVHRTSRASF
jgi:hypothetical protein